MNAQLLRYLGDCAGVEWKTGIKEGKGVSLRIASPTSVDDGFSHLPLLFLWHTVMHRSAKDLGAIVVAVSIQLAQSNSARLDATRVETGYFLKPSPLDAIFLLFVFGVVYVVVAIDGRRDQMVMTVERGRISVIQARRGSQSAQTPDTDRQRR